MPLLEAWGGYVSSVNQWRGYLTFRYSAFVKGAIFRACTPFFSNLSPHLPYYLAY